MELEKGYLHVATEPRVLSNVPLRSAFPGLMLCFGGESRNNFKIIENQVRYRCFGRRPKLSSISKPRSVTFLNTN